jgi:hypothetical protein
MLPPYPAGGPAPVPPGEPAPAEATQALPLFQDAQPFDEYGRPQQAHPGQQYGGGQPYADPQAYGAEQQFAAPAGYDQQPAPPAGYDEQPPPPDSDYDHLFRNDVPAPEPMRPRILQPHGAQQPRPQQPGYGQQQWQQQGGGYADGGYDGYEGYDDGDDGGRRRMSPKVLIGIVVAGCVVAGLVVGGLMSGGGGKAGADDSAAKPSAPASGKPGSSASGDGASTGAADGAEGQAKALDALLSSSGASRSSVVNAVEDIKGCKDLQKAAADLRSAATQRDGLVTQLQNLSVDKLPKHDELTSALTKAWKASSAADGHYAAWADQAANNGSVCKGGHARSTGEQQAGNQQSSTATTQKKAAVKLWNSIAAQYGLTKRQYSQL